LSVDGLRRTEEPLRSLPAHRRRGETGLDPPLPSVPRSRLSGFPFIAGSRRLGEAAGGRDTGRVDRSPVAEPTPDTGLVPVKRALSGLSLRDTDGARAREAVSRALVSMLRRTPSGRAMVTVRSPILTWRRESTVCSIARPVLRASSAGDGGLGSARRPARVMERATEEACTACRAMLSECMCFHGTYVA
jgi:hypothetical protein